MTALVARTEASTAGAGCAGVLAKCYAELSSAETLGRAYNCATSARTIDVELRDIGRGLAEWGSALKHSADNPIVLLGQRTERPRASKRWIAGLSWAGVLGALLLGAHYAAPYFSPRLGAQYVPTLAVALALLGWLALWLGWGLYDAAVFAVKLISRPGDIAAGALQLDETLQASRLSDREITVGMALLVLPRIAARWAFGSLGALLLLVLWQLALSRQEGAASATVTSEVLHEHFSLQGFLSALPLSIGLLALTGLLASTVLVLWLMTLGRGVAAEWQMHLLAASVTLVQLAWVPIAVWRMSAPAEPTWAADRAPVPGAENNWLLGFFAFLAVPAFLAGTLHFARRRPFFRLSVAALLPPLGLALWCLLPHPQGDVGIAVLSGTPLWLEEQLRFFGALALVNPLALSYPSLLGLDWYAAAAYSMFGWYRLPLLLVLQLGALAICAHAARLAVADWRSAEE